MASSTWDALGTIWAALRGAPRWLNQLHVTCAGDLLSVFPVTDLAGASVGAACLAVAELVAARHGARPGASVDRRLASLWFGSSLRPKGWSLPPTSDAVAGDYQAADGWIKLHTNAPHHHRAAALAVLDAPAERDQVAQAVGRWQAEVLRIDPPGWDEPAIVPGVTLGKRCARLDLRQPGDRAAWEGLLRAADVLVHGYRPGALARLGLDGAGRRALCPGLVDVSLDAYGWHGPWQGRRGFDSLVQMGSGLADAGMRLGGRDQPTPLPVQVLDHATATSWRQRSCAA